jgi:hypothetical protein
MRNQEEQQKVRETHLTEIPIDDAQPSNPKMIDSTSNRLSNQNESAFHINNASNQSSFDPLSSELLCQILGYCTLSELYILKQVCKLWKQTIEDFPTIGVLRTYEINLKHSILWSYLPAITNNEPLFAFIRELLHPFQIPEEQQTDFTTLSAFCTKVQRNLFVKYQFSYKNKITAEYIVQQAQVIGEYIERFGQPKATKLEVWFDFEWHHHDSLLGVFQAYLDLENVLSTMAFIIQTSQLKKLSSKVSEICSSQTSYWPRGEDLIGLEAYVYRLLSHIIEQSVILHIYFQDIKSLSTELAVDLVLQEQYQQRLATLDHLLERLEYADWLQFLEIDKTGYAFHPRVRLLARALKINHPAVPSQLTESVSFLLLNTKEREPSTWWPYKRKEQREEFLHTIFDTDDEPSPIEKEAKMRSMLNFSSRDDLKKARDILQKKLQDLKAEDTDDETLQLKHVESAQQSIGLPSSQLSTSNSGPAIITQSTTTLPRGQAASTSFDWRFALKIGGTVLLGLIGVGLALTGIGSFVCLPLLIALSLPLFAKVLLLAVGAITFLASVTIGIYCSIKKVPHHQRMDLPDLPSDSPDRDPLHPSQTVFGQTPRMIHTFNQTPSLSFVQQENISTFEQSATAPHYSSPIIQPHRISSCNKLPITHPVEHILKSTLNTETVANSHRDHRPC